MLHDIIVNSRREMISLSLQWFFKKIKYLLQDDISLHNVCFTLGTLYITLDRRLQTL